MVKLTRIRNTEKIANRQHIDELNKMQKKNSIQLAQKTTTTTTTTFPS